MLIGVVSDTHDNLSNVARIVELFNASGVERVIHTGDITRARTLEIFGRLDARLYGVYGNNDHEREALDGAARRGRLRGRPRFLFRDRFGTELVGELRRGAVGLRRRRVQVVLGGVRNRVSVACRGDLLRLLAHVTQARRRSRSSSSYSGK